MERREAIEVYLDGLQSSTWAHFSIKDREGMDRAINFIEGLMGRVQKIERDNEEAIHEIGSMQHLRAADFVIGTNGSILKDRSGNTFHK